MTAAKHYPSLSEVYPKITEQLQAKLLQDQSTSVEINSEPE